MLPAYFIKNVIKDDLGGHSAYNTACDPTDHRACTLRYPRARGWCLRRGRASLRSRHRDPTTNGICRTRVPVRNRDRPDRNAGLVSGIGSIVRWLFDSHAGVQAVRSNAHSMGHTRGSRITPLESTNEHWGRFVRRRRRRSPRFREASRTGSEWRARRSKRSWA